MSDKKSSKQEHHLADWMQKIQEASIPHQAPINNSSESKELHESNHHKTAVKKLDYIIVLLILLFGFIYRLSVMFLFTGPENAGVGWYGDTYHHWQIAYLTGTTGFHNGFLRLWDLKGMEYFWGLLHPLFLNLLFLLTGSTNIILARILSSVFGMSSVFMLFLLSMRYYSRRVAYAITFFGSAFAIAVFNDASGMLEPIGIFFMLLGVYSYPKKPFLTGFSFVLAAMVRAEAWVFSIGLLIGILLMKGFTHKKTIVVGVWLISTLVYMKYLLDHTGNAIYPIYWNFLANGLGSWAGVDPLTPLQITVKPILMFIALLSSGILIYLVIKKPRNLTFLLLGFGNIFFVTAFMGFGHYIHGWEWWFPVIRFFVFPYLFIMLLVFAAIDKMRVGNRAVWSTFFTLIVLAITIASQLSWIPIAARFEETKSEWNRSVSWGKTIGRYYSGGTVLFPDGDPHFTYTAVQYGNVYGKNILSQMFDPFYYIGEDLVLSKWDKYEKSIIDDWIIKNNIKLAVIRNDTSRYAGLIEKRPDLFEKMTVLEGGVYEIWKVNAGKNR